MTRTSDNTLLPGSDARRSGHVPGRLRSRLRKRLDAPDKGAFWLYASPWIVGFAIFSVYPIVYSLFLAFNEWNIIGDKVWVGTENFETMVADPLFWQSLKVTGVYTLFAVPLGVIMALALAMLLNQRVRGVNIFRTIFYIPSVISGVAAAMLWAWIFNPEFGVMNAGLGLLGIEGPKWLFAQEWVIPALVIMSLWSVGGSMIIYLAALQGVPTELYEAARVDGAGWWSRFWHVTLPQISPVIFFTLITGMINTFQTFTQAYVMTNGGPQNASLFFGLYLYNNAFRYLKMGYASALAWTLLLIVLLLTLVVFVTARFWVHYDTDATGGW
ncbi:MAG: sugar ABC transporter permease [Coriobacteriia bacterium]|nr:sugar ABC transporter permease [Coriobacteriia bacterium]